MRFAVGAAALLATAGCSTVPSAGPTARQIRRDEKRDNTTGFRIVDIDTGNAAGTPARTPGAGPLSALAREGRTDTLGPGDVLQIDVYEVGVSLFAKPATGSGQFTPAAGATILGASVAADGTITLPYIGRVTAQGRTAADIERLIESGMVGLSQRPQVTVSVRTNLYNTYYVSGDVRASGRFDLGLPRQRLLDALARAGGTVNASGNVSQPNDMVVRLIRDGVAAETRLSEIGAATSENVELLPGDRIELVNQPRTFLVFGSTDRVSQLPFSASDLSLAEALARVGGPSERIADPAAVFLFRWGVPEVPGGVPRPIVYRLDMTRADSFLLSQRFGMQDKDVVYIASAAVNAPAKLTQIIGQLFTPFAIARSVTN
jgi:polysaccharide export outer membrane protein